MRCLAANDYEERGRDMDEAQSQYPMDDSTAEEQAVDTDQILLKLADATTALDSKTQESLYELSRLKRLLTDFNSRLEQAEGHSQALAIRFQDNERALAKLKKQAWGISALGLALVGMLLGGGGLGIRLIAAQNKRIGWLLEKANRRECIEGIKPASDPQCQ